MSGRLSRLLRPPRVAVVGASNDRYTPASSAIFENPRVGTGPTAMVTQSGGDSMTGGHIAPGGEPPVNTNAGGRSYCHRSIYGLLLVVEAVRRGGDRGDLQVPGCEVALAHGNGGGLSSQRTLLLGGAATA